MLLYSWMWGCPLEHRKHTSEHKVKENWCWKLQKPTDNSSSTKGMALGATPLYAKMFTVLFLCRQPQLLGVSESFHIQNALVFTLVFPNLWLLKSSSSSAVVFELLFLWLSTPLALAHCTLISSELLWPLATAQRNFFDGVWYLH